MGSMYSEAESYEKVQEKFTLTIQFGMDRPQTQFKAVVGYKNYLRKLDEDNKKKNKNERIYDTAIRAFLAVQPYLDYVKEKMEYTESGEGADTDEPAKMSIQNLSPVEREVFKEVQLMLWERIERFVISMFPKDILKNRYEYEVLYQTMFVDFSSKMIFRYKPYSPERKMLVRPTTYFAEHIYKNAFTTYQSEKNEMTKHDIDKTTKIQKAINSMQANNIQPTVEKIAGITDLSVGVVKAALVNLETRKTVSLDAKIKDDDGNESENVKLPKSNLPSPEEETIRREMDHILADLVNTELTELERKVFFLRDDIWDENEAKHMPYKDIAEKLNLQERDVKRIHNSARRKLSKSRKLGIALNHVRPSINKKDSRKINSIMVSQMRSAIESSVFPEGKICDMRGKGDDEEGEV